MVDLMFFVLSCKTEMVDLMFFVYNQGLFTPGYDTL